MDSTTLPFGTLRLATIRDIPRICIVATAGFFYSPTFEWERRYHHQYPADTIKSYAKIFADLIRNPGCVVLVIEDSYQPDENTRTGATIPKTPDLEHLQSGDSVIVGLTAWRLPFGSKYFGQFTDQDDLSSSNSPVFDGGFGRDKDMPHALPMYELISAEEEKHFQHHMIIERVVVHPAYWRRSHGKTLVNWGLALAETDKIKTGVVANTVGVGLYLALGFMRIEMVKLEDEEEPPNALEGVILRYDV